MSTHIPLQVALRAANRLMERLAATSFADEAQKAAAMRQWADAERATLEKIFTPRRRRAPIPLVRREPTKRYWAGYEDGRAIQLGRLADTYRARGLASDAPYLRGLAQGREDVIHGVDPIRFSDSYRPE